MGMNSEEWAYSQIDSPFKFFTQVACKLHLKTISAVQIRGLDKMINPDVFMIIPECFKCSDVSKLPQNNLSVPLMNIFHIMKLGTYISQSFKQAHSQGYQIKTQIKTYLCQKQIRKGRISTFYQQLSPSNHQFLQHEDSAYKHPDQIQGLSMNMEGQVFRQSKKWIIDPQGFQGTFHIQMCKDNLKRLLNIKHSVLYSLTVLRHLFITSGLRSLNPGLQRDLLSINPQMLQAHVLGLISLKKDQILKNKLLVLRSIRSLVKMQTKMQDLNLYMGQFVKLYHEHHDQAKNLAKFRVTQEVLKQFSFDIAQHTVVLRNPNLDQSGVYRQIDYESQFAFVNDGQFVFNNEYRPNMLCEEEIDIQRSQSTMVGSQFHPRLIQLKGKMPSGKTVQIDQPLIEGTRVYLRMRLNSDEFDKVSIRFIWSSSYQKLLLGEKDLFVNISLYIIPDSGYNSAVYGFTPKSLLTRGNLGNRAIFKQNQDEKLFLVLEDDVISLSYTDSSVICVNETRNQLIQQVKIIKSKDLLCEKLQFQFEVYGAIVLYTTVSQVQIFQSQKRK